MNKTVYMYIFNITIEDKNVDYILNLINTLKDIKEIDNPIYLKFVINTDSKKIIKYKKINNKSLFTFLDNIFYLPIDLNFDIRLVLKHLTEEDMEIFNIVSVF